MLPLDGRCCGRREAAWQASSWWRASSEVGGGAPARQVARFGPYLAGTGPERSLAAWPACRECMESRSGRSMGRNPLHYQNCTGGSKTTRAFQLHPKWSLVISKGCRMLPYGSISFSYHHTPLLIPMHSLLYHLCESFASSAQCVTVSLCHSDPSRTRRVHK